MEKYLAKLVGKKIGVTRVGFPKEVYFEARLAAVEGGVALFEEDGGREAAVPVDKILLVGKQETGKAGEKSLAGFVSGDRRR